MSHLFSEEKSSTSRVSQKSGSYSFRLEGFSGLSTRVGDSIESPEFSLCGYTWQLRIFPGGSLEAHKNYLSFYLASKSNVVARASYRLIIASQIQGGEDETFASSGTRVFEAKGVQVDGWGRDKFISLSLLKNPEYGFCVDDAVDFRVEIIAFGDLEDINGDSDGVVYAKQCNCGSYWPLYRSSCPHNKSLGSRHYLKGAIGALLDDPITADVVFFIHSMDLDEARYQSVELEEKSKDVGVKVDRIHAHRVLLLARSEVFKAMFCSSMSEATKGEVHIFDFESVVIRALLNYIYTDEAPTKEFLNEFVAPLLAVSVKYQVLGLVYVCEDFLYDKVSIETSINLLYFADSVGATALKIKILTFIACNSSKIYQTKEFRDLSGELLQETAAAVEVYNKRRGCGGGTSSGSSAILSSNVTEAGSFTRMGSRGESALNHRNGTPTSGCVIA